MRLVSYLMVLTFGFLVGCNNNSDKKINPNTEESIPPTEKMKYGFKIIYNSDPNCGAYSKIKLAVVDNLGSVVLYDDAIDYLKSETALVTFSFQAFGIFELITESDGYGNYKYSNTLFGTNNKVDQKNTTDEHIKQLNKYIDLTFKLPIKNAESSSDPILRVINKVYYDMDKFKHISMKDKKYGYQKYVLNNNGKLEYGRNVLGDVYSTNPEIYLRRGAKGELIVDKWSN